MKKTLNNIAIWLYKKTSEIPTGFRVRSGIDIGGKYLQVETKFTNDMVVNVRDLKSIIKLELGDMITDLIKNAKVEIGKRNAIDIFGGKRVYETPYLPNDQVFVGTGKIGNTPFHPNFDMTDVKMKD